MRNLVSIMLVCCLLIALPVSTYAATVLIDPGHGGSDPGAIGVTGLREKGVNLDIALMVRDELESRGYDVVMTRSTDKYLSLQDRIAIADSVMPDILVSIHANSYHSPHVAGTIVLYYDSRYPQRRYPASEAMIRLSPESRKLAQSLLEGATQAAGTINRGLLESAAYMVRKGSVPSALIETAFLSNVDDEQLLRDPEFRKNMAIGIANGIANYLPLPIHKQHFGDVINHWARDDIFYLYDLGIVEGDGHYYSPDRQLTRAEFVTMLDRSGLLIPDESGRDTTDGNTSQINDDNTHAETNHNQPNENYLNVEARNTNLNEDVEDENSGFDEDENMIPVQDEMDELNEMEELDELDELDEEQEHGDIDPDENESSPQMPVFTDFSVEHWAYESMIRAAETGVLKGFLDGTIRPDALITRAEVSVILDRLIYDEPAIEPSIEPVIEPDDETAENDILAAYTDRQVYQGGTIRTYLQMNHLPYVDVLPGKWYTDAIYRLWNDRLVRGVSETSFAPHKPINRAEAAVLIARYLRSLEHKNNFDQS